MLASGRSSSQADLDDVAQHGNSDDCHSVVSLADKSGAILVGMVPDYVEENVIGAYAAIIIFKLLEWERDWLPEREVQQEDALLPASSSVKNNPAPPPVTYLKKLGMFATAFVQALSKDKEPESKRDLLNAVINGIVVSGNQQRLQITTLGAEMLRYFCKDDNKSDPSILFDAIVVGTMVFTLAMDDTQRRQHGKGSTIANLYPISLKRICLTCGLNKKFGSAAFYKNETPEIKQVMQYLILRIGYNVLIEKSLFFNQRIATQLLLPRGRFEKYRITQEVVDSCGTPPDISDQLMEGESYTLQWIRDLVSAGSSLDDVFQDVLEAKVPSLLLHSQVFV